ncbi:unnamed protein product [Sphenostylis stenocarpa]|uniref:Wound-responsive family protein n=1 Tax=Sphenostylis stenocarpa TaxID=92480 RepID=A0AA86W5F3_9FABA|nr:unnamed protein product [Sphenostylis stenocarpa]
MSSAQRGWIVATSVGVVEALKDQGVCRWNHAFKSAQHVIKTHFGSLSRAKNLSSSVLVSTSSRLKVPTIRSWGVATGVGVVEALKDQGICRWNQAIRSAQQHLKTHVGSFSQAKKLSSTSTMVSEIENTKQSESLRKVLGSEYQHKYTQLK